MPKNKVFGQAEGEGIWGQKLMTSDFFPKSFNKFAGQMTET